MLESEATGSEPIPGEFPPLFSCFGFFEDLKEGRLNFSASDVEARENLRPTEKRFLLNLIALGNVDPEIVKLAFSVRNKLANNLPLTNAEAEQFICGLQGVDFPGTTLNLSGMSFPELNLEDGVVGSLIMQGTSVKSNAFFKNLLIDTFCDQREMKVGRGCDQREMKVGRGCDQREMEVGGDCYQGGMEVGGFCYQGGMEVGGYCYQVEMKVRGDCDQGGMKVGGFCHQGRMEVGEGYYQRGMEVGGFCDQSEMKVGGDCNQREMKVGGDCCQVEMKVGWNCDQREMKVGGVCCQIGMKVKGVWRK